MKVIVLILNKVELLDKLLTTLSENGVTGGTILNSTGMARALASDDTSIFGSLRLFLDPSRKESKTILFVQKEDVLSRTITIIKNIIGDFSKPDTGILFTIPIDYAEGIKY